MSTRRTPLGGISKKPRAAAGGGTSSGDIELAQVRAEFEQELGRPPPVGGRYASNIAWMKQKIVEARAVEETPAVLFPTRTSRR